MTNLKAGESAIVRVRLINKVAGDPSKGFNYQIEVREQHTEKNILMLFNPTDTRINPGKAAVAFRGIEPEVFQELFPQSAEIKAKLDALKPSKGLKGAQLVENTHYVNVEVLNPTVNGQRLGVQIVESIVSPFDGATPKINPTTGAIITFQGKPVYRTTSVEFNPQSIRLTSDKVDAAVPFEAESKVMAPNLQAAIN